jgi:hypothetical protein
MPIQGRFAPERASKNAGEYEEGRRDAERYRSDAAINQARVAEFQRDTAMSGTPIKPFIRDDSLDFFQGQMAARRDAENPARARGRRDGMVCFVDPFPKSAAHMEGRESYNRSHSLDAAVAPVPGAEFRWRSA